MSKATSESTTLSTPVLQIALPLEWDSDTASALPPEATEPPSGAATPAAVKEAKPRKWYSLYDKVYALPNLKRAWEQVRANKGAPGCDGQTVEQFAAKQDENLERLHQALREKKYHPQPVRRVEIPKSGGGTRPLGIPTVRDRIVQQALHQVLSPIFEEQFSPRSHGFRPGRSCETALDVVDRALRYGYEWVVDADISKFFDNVDHELLLDELNKQVSDGSVLKLVRAFLESGVLMGGGEFEPTEIGTPQGGPLSPLLANIFLHPFDVAMAAAGYGLVRYADDFVIFAKSSEKAGEALAEAQRVLERLKLNLHPEKTRIAAIDEGFEFLGYRYVRDEKGRVQKVVGRKAQRKFREHVRELTPRHGGQRRPKAKRCTLQRLRRSRRVRGTVGKVSKYLREWHGYFRGVRSSWRDPFDGFDDFVRRRIRSIIIGRFATAKWNRVLPTKVLEGAGLVSLKTLHSRFPTGPLNAAPNPG